MVRVHPRDARRLLETPGLERAVADADDALPVALADGLRGCIHRNRAPDAGIGVYEYVGIGHYLEDLLAARVDIANSQRLKASVRPSAEQDAIHAF